MNYTTQLDVISKLEKGALDPTVYVIDKGIKEHWLENGHLGDIIHHWLSPIQKAFYHNRLAAAI